MAWLYQEYSASESDGLEDELESNQSYSECLLNLMDGLYTKLDAKDKYVSFVLLSAKSSFSCYCISLIRAIHLKSIGNLSTDVFEPRTATATGMFSFLVWFCSFPWTGKLLFLCLRFDVTNAMASKRSKEGKIQLPVDVRGSKTCVLKFPIFWSESYADLPA